jgi:hypothetical protein
MGGEEGSFSGIPFWEALLNQGLRITGVGGSDNHDPSLGRDTPSAVGMPTTVIEASELSETAILEAIRRGRVAIDLDGTADRTLDFTARTGGCAASMGGTLVAGADETVDFEVIVNGAPEGRIEPIHDGEIIAASQGTANDAGETRARFSLVADGSPHWTRINLRDGFGRLTMIGNPIYWVGE